MNSAGEVEVTIARADISDIDHPGNGAAAIETALLGTGLAMIIGGAVAASKRPKPLIRIGPGPEEIVGGVGIFVVVAGLVPAVVGWGAWSSSRAKAAPPTTAASKVQVTPVALTHGEDTYYGGSASIVW